MLRLLVAAVMVVSAAASAVPWTSRADLRVRSTKLKAVAVPREVVNLDLAPEDRWTHLANQTRFKKLVPGIVDYLESEVPKWAMPLISIAGGKIGNYFKEYGAEITSIASTMGIDKGYLVTVNLIMQVESIGINCSNWNNTGPTHKDDPGCVAIDPKQDICYCKKAAEEPSAKNGYLGADGILRVHPHDAAGIRSDGPSGPCTSVIAAGPTGRIFHGRNLDWNVPPVIRSLLIDVDFQRGGKTVFTGTTALGFVGLINGMRAGADGYSASINARHKGGKLLKNFLEALLHKAMTPAQHMRYAFEQATSFDTLVSTLSAGDLIDDIYYTVGGGAKGEGVVVARDRNDVADAWKLDVTNATDPDNWFRLQTNYDRTLPVPTSDDRRHPGIANMHTLGQAGAAANFDASAHYAEKGLTNLWDVMTTWPTYNHHTDYSCVMSAANGTYESFAWFPVEA